VGDHYTRRQFFRNFPGLLAKRARNQAEDGIACHGNGAHTTTPWLRPPGALEEPAFLAMCTRCTDCLDACPYESIRRLGPEYGEVADTPAIVPHEAPCYVCKDLPCITACTTGALQPLERQNVRMATAVIDLGRCYQARGQPCDYCVTRCPFKGEAIGWDHRGWPRIEPQSCAGCSVCAYLCPAEAITVEGITDGRL
jgi:ferredoxin-type protein NapG